MSETLWPRLLACQVSLGLLCGCTTTGGNPINAGPIAALQADTKVFVAIPPNACYGTQNCLKSGQGSAKAVNSFVDSLFK